jgi:predicted transcriptional regulator
MSKKKKSTKTEYLSVRVSPQTKKALEKIAANEDRTVSWLVARILDDYVAARAKRQRGNRRLRGSGR